MPPEAERGTSPQVLAATPTAFDGDGQLDLSGCAALFRWLGRTRLDGVFVNGTAGEFPTLSRMERRLVAELALALVPPEKRTIIHIGASSCHEVLRLLEDAHRLGATEVAVITPYFLPTTRVAILDFFRRVSDSADGMKVYPYLYRQITRNEIDEDLLARIAELPHVAGAKITGETPERLGRYVASCPLGFDIYAGLDRHVAEVQRYGACGVIAAMSSALPWPFLRLASATSSGDEAGIRDAQDEVDTVCRVLNGDIARTKVALRIQGIPVGRPRLPLEEPSPVVTREIARVVSLYGLYPAGEH